MSASGQFGADPPDPGQPGSATTRRSRVLHQRRESRLSPRVTRHVPFRSESLRLAALALLDDGSVILPKELFVLLREAVLAVGVHLLSLPGGELPPGVAVEIAHGRGLVR